MKYETRVKIEANREEIEELAQLEDNPLGPIFRAALIAYEEETEE